MYNVLTDNLDMLRNISKMIANETGVDLIICDSNGEIIESTILQSIGKINNEAAKIVTGHMDEVAITLDNTEKYLVEELDISQGYICAIRVSEKKVGSLGLIGNSELLKPIVRIAAKTIGLVMSEYIKEKEKNVILQKIAKIAEEIAQQPLEKHIYQNFVDDIWHISEARLVVFELLDAASGKLTVAALAGQKNDLDKISAELGYEIIGRSREYPDKRKNYNNGFVFCDEIEEFINDLMPFEKYKNLKKCLNIGQVCILEIVNKDEISGNFIFFLESNKKLNNVRLVELYAARVGQLLVRINSEIALKKREAKLKDALTILQYQSNHDALTGAYNRTFFEKAIIELEQRDNYPIATISLDVDGLKVVNDTMGHAKGDELLVKLVKILRKSIRKIDILTRVGGDEFVIILLKTDRKKAELIVERINQNIEEFNQQKPEFLLSVSIGVATADDQSRSLQDMIKSADKEMYKEKNVRKNGINHRL